MICYTNKHKRVFEIDDDDWEIVQRYSWSISDGYPSTNIINWSRSSKVKHFTTIKLHALLLGRALPGLEWDHIDRNRLNNKRSNFRLVNDSLSSRNRNKRIDNSSGVTGISRNHQKWKAYISVIPRKQIILGYFNSKEEAILARKQAEEKYWGTFRG